MDQQAAPWHFVAIVGDLALRNVIVLIVMSEPVLETVTVIFAVTGTAFLMNAERLTVPPAFGLAENPLPFRPFGQPLPAHVTFTLAPAGTPLTWSRENFVDFEVALAKKESVNGIDVGLAACTTTGGGACSSAPSQFSSMPLSGTSVAPGWIAGLASLQSTRALKPSSSSSEAATDHERETGALTLPA